MSTNETGQNRTMQRPADTGRFLLFLSLIVALAVGGVIGFFIGKSSGSSTVATTQTAPAQQVASLPPGVTRLPSRAFGHWVLNCIQNAQGAKRCQLSMRVVNPQHNLLLHLLVSRDSKARPIFVVITPPNVVLPAGVRMVLGSSPPAKANFLSCTSASCQVVLLIDKNLENGLSAADTTQISYVASNNHPVGYKLPTANFHDAYEAWQANYPGAD